jgi:hypothetical protein
MRMISHGYVQVVLPGRLRMAFGGSGGAAVAHDEPERAQLNAPSTAKIFLDRLDYFPYEGQASSWL